MNYAYFGMKAVPFSKEIEVKHLFDNYDQKEALSRLSYIKQNRGIFLLTGEPGGGKTTTLRRFVDSLNPQTHESSYSPLVTINRNEIYRQINSLLGLTPTYRKSQLFKQIQEAVWDKYRHQGIIPCLILDECHLMDYSTLQELVIITNFQMDAKVPLILILAGQPSLKEILKRRAMEALNQRITLSYHMAGMSLEETRNYILHHLNLVGRKEPLFEERSFEIIHQLGLGLPRKIGNICLAAMIYTQHKQEQTITAETIHQCGGGI